MYSEKRIEFSVSEEKNLACFIAELERENVDYEVKNLIGGWVVIIKKGK